MDCSSPSRKAFLSLGGVGIASLAGCARTADTDDGLTDDETSSDSDTDEVETEESESQAIAIYVFADEKIHLQREADQANEPLSSSLYRLIQQRAQGSRERAAAAFNAERWIEAVLAKGTERLEEIAVNTRVFT